MTKNEFSKRVSKEIDEFFEVDQDYSLDDLEELEEWFNELEEVEIDEAFFEDDLDLNELDDFEEWVQQMEKDA